MYSSFGRAPFKPFNPVYVVNQGGEPSGKRCFPIGRGGRPEREAETERQRPIIRNRGVHYFLAGIRTIRLIAVRHCVIVRGGGQIPDEVVDFDKKISSGRQATDGKTMDSGLLFTPGQIDIFPNGAFAH